MEEWRDVPGYEGLYQVSNLGYVKSLNWKRTGKEQLLALVPCHKRYYSVSLTKDGKRKHYFIHRLVWEAFNGPILEGMQINHINEDITDNRLENLSLVTPSENVNWGTRNKRVGEKMTNGKTSKWVIKLSINNEILHFYPSTAQAERETGIKQGNISKCCCGKREFAGGYKWKYSEYKQYNYGK